MLFTADVLAKGAISQKYSVTYFSSQNGVEDGLVNDIIQDHKGLLWFATWNGLYRLMVIILRIINRIWKIWED